MHKSMGGFCCEWGMGMETAHAQAPWDVLALCVPLNCGIDGIPLGHHPAMMMFSNRLPMMMLAHVFPRPASGYLYY